MLRIFGRISSSPWGVCREFLSNREYFYLMIKALRRGFAALTVTVLALRAVASFLSWIERQDESVADTWVDEDELEDA